MSETANNGPTPKSENEIASVEPLATREFGSAYEPEAADKSLKAFDQKFYDEINDRLDATRHGHFSYFLSYGYVPDVTPSFAVKLPKGFLNKNPTRLVLETIGLCNDSGKRVLDVSCGRGWTVHILKEYFRPGSVNAIDPCPKAIEFCRKTHKYPEVSLDQGSGMRTAARYHTKCAYVM